MFKNYLLIGWRNLWRNKVLSFINITGLSIGLACCMLIFLYVKDEVSYDRFHENKDRLYRVTCTILEKDAPPNKFGISAMVQGPSFKESIPEVKDYVRVQESDFTIKRGNETFPDKATWVDENFFSVFSFPLISGSVQTALKDNHSMVVTDEAAIKYFGTKDAIGKILEVEINDTFVPFIISAVAKRSPQNSTIKFSILLPFNYLVSKENDHNWMWLSYPTFLVMNEKVDIKAVSSKMQKIFETQAKDQILDEKKHGGGGQFIWSAQPFLDMHLDKEFNYTADSSDPIYSYILSGIALFILIIACINFVNLTVAQSLKRGKEIGIRKVIGGQRKQLIGQFLGESFLLCFLAFILAILLAQVCLPVFNELSNKRLSLSYLLDTNLVVSFIILFFLTGLAAGFYPALVLSSFDPVKTLYNRTRFAGKNYLSKSLVIVQFALATFLIITTFFIYSQFDYLTKKDLGYNDKNLLKVNVGRGGDHELMNVFYSEFSKIPGIAKIAPRMQGQWGTNSKANGKDIDVRYEHIDENYLPTLEIPLVAGRNFSSAYPADSTNSVLVNEAYVKAAGWTDPIGKTIDFLNGGDVKLTVVGVVKDYHYESLKQKIQPQLFSSNQNLPFGKFVMRVDKANLPRTLVAVEKAFRSIIPNHPFDYVFEQEANLKNYDAENKWKQIITFAAIITIFISAIGLFGLTSLSIQKRTKEIGVRKVLGASVFQVSSLVSKDFILLVMIAFVIAIPAAWFAVDKWLQNFAYRIPESWWVFALAAVLTIIIALITVSFQAIKAALSNPVKSLRTE